jgi:hypothetical protein
MNRTCNVPSFKLSFFRPVLLWYFHFADRLSVATVSLPLGYSSHSNDMFLLSYNTGTKNHEEDISSYWLTIRERKDTGN